MKKTIVTASLLLGVLVLTVPTHAGQQQTGEQTKQKITKKDNNLAAHSSVSYNGAPQFASIEGTSISYATNTPQEVISIGDVFYLNMYVDTYPIRNLWLMSAKSQ